MTAALADAMPQLATVKEVAEYLGLKEDTVERHVRSGKIPGVKVGRRWLIHVDRYKAQLEAGTTGQELAS